MRRRRGTAYVLVLVVSAIVVVTGLSSLLLMRTQAAGGALAEAWASAQVEAASGVDYALLEIEKAVVSAEMRHRHWRDGFVHGQEMGPVTFGGGAFTWTLLDDSGDTSLGDDPRDPVRLVVRAESGGASHRMAVQLAAGPSREPLPLLARALHGGDVMLILGEASIEADGAVSSNASITAAAAEVYATAAAPVIVGMSFHGASFPGQGPLEMPDPSLIDHYADRAVEIPIAALPGGEGGHELSMVVLSPTNNPYGDESFEGIYLVDCHGLDLRVHHCRIVGTLIVVDPGPGSAIPSDTVIWEPAFANEPALLVDGDLTIDASFEPIAEWRVDRNRARNLNPPDTPYDGRVDGVTWPDDAQQAAVTGGETWTVGVHDDVYPGAMAGLVYVTGDLVIKGDRFVLEGLIIAGGRVTVEAGTAVSIDHRRDCLDDPPFGFSTPTGAPFVVPGSFVQVVE